MSALEGRRPRSDKTVAAVFWIGTTSVLPVLQYACFIRKTEAGSTGLILAISRHVIWFYERKGEHLRCEIRQLVEGDKFALVVTMPDGSERTELFDDSGALNRRSVELEQMLTTKGWNGPYARDI
jgi:hypothetical protein